MTAAPAAPTAAPGTARHPRPPAADRSVPSVDPSASPAVGPAVGAALAVAAAVAVAGLALASTGSMVVAAVLLGVATRDRRSALAAVLAVAAVGVRFATTDFGDIAGIQSVLGAAGVVGPPTAAASAWLAATAVLLAAVPARQRPGVVVGAVADDADAVDDPDPARDGAPGVRRLRQVLVPVAGGAFAACIAVGPGPGGALEARVVATVAAVLLASALGVTGRWRRVTAVRAVAAVAAGLAAVALAGWPS